MAASDLLDGLLALFAEQIPEAEFLRAWRGRAESRKLNRPVVTGEIDGETLKPGSREARYKFRIFLPEGEGAERAEELFASMCALAGQEYPGFSAISRGGTDRDKATGLLTVSCVFSFVTGAGAGGVSAGCQVTLGGKEYIVSSVKTTLSQKGEELVSIGETVPFAVRGEETEYTVELEGIETSGLENMAAFTAEIGDRAVYLNCRWKSLSDALGKASFVSRQKAGTA